MEQLDFISPNHYLYDKVRKLEDSMDKRTRRLFGHIKDLQDELIEVKKNYRQLSGNSGQLKEES